MLLLSVPQKFNTFNTFNTFKLFKPLERRTISAPVTGGSERLGSTNLLQSGRRASSYSFLT